MLSSLKDNGADNSDLTSKIMSTLEPVMTEHWPKIEPYANQALAAAHNDETVEMLARKVYPWLPMMLRLAVKEDKFVSLALEHKGPLLAKLAELKNKQNS
ncbi:hypothetical protein [Mucilaginibacter lacusdianchii]|uniref:hypothetical protein n=1 Tax=Mucilaginibacter lacusdianchii TaxID=2684211 RepID=UPI00131B9DD0|nr:hypothetical protein [Mucilaginibacter sp. JXJ CY 39]